MEPRTTFTKPKINSRQRYFCFRRRVADKTENFFTYWIFLRLLHDSHFHRPNSKFSILPFSYIKKTRNKNRRITRDQRSFVLRKHDDLMNFLTRKTLRRIKRQVLTFYFHNSPEVQFLSTVWFIFSGLNPSPSRRNAFRNKYHVPRPKTYKTRDTFNLSYLVCLPIGANTSQS